MSTEDSIWDIADRVYEQFGTDRFPPVTEAQVTELEDRINVTFPEMYREYLLRYNGGYFTEPLIVADEEYQRPQDRLTSLSGIDALDSFAELGSSRSLSILDDNAPPQIVPIGSTIMNYLILLVVDPTEDDYGVLIHKAFDTSYPLSDNIADFFGLITAPPADE